MTNAANKINSTFFPLFIKCNFSEYSCNIYKLDDGLLIKNVVQLIREEPRLILYSIEMKTYIFTNDLWYFLLSEIIITIYDPDFKPDKSAEKT